MKQEIVERYVYNLPETCKLLRIGRNTALKLINRKELPAMKVGRQYRILGESLLEFLRRPVRRKIWEETVSDALVRSRGYFQQWLKSQGYDPETITDEEVETLIGA